jgi:segregation and condensation protein B
METENLLSQLESLLLVAYKPISLSEIAKLFSLEVGVIKEAIEKLQLGYQEHQRGMRLTITNDKVQLVSAPENSDIVKAFIKEETSGEMTPAALETLTIVAYRQPIAKAELEQIRGVNCSLILRNLLIRGLVEAQFSKERGTTVYAVTNDFLKFLGLDSVAALPEYEKLNTNQLLEALNQSTAATVTEENDVVKVTVTQE